MKKILYLLLALVLMFTLVACTENTPAETSAETAAEETTVEETTEETQAEETQAEAPAEGTEVTLRRAYTAPHGDKSFGRFVVALVDGKIVAAKNEVGQVVATSSEDLANTELKATLGATLVDGTGYLQLIVDASK